MHSGKVMRHWWSMAKRTGSNANFQSQRSAPRVFVNGRNIDFDVAPTIENNRTLVPMRAILEALGLEVSWDAATQTVTATNGEIEVELLIGGQAYVNGKPSNLDVPAKIINGRTKIAEISKHKRTVPLCFSLVLFLCFILFFGIFNHNVFPIEINEITIIIMPNCLKNSRLFNTVRFHILTTDC